jgi:hypothetical protein
MTDKNNLLETLKNLQIENQDKAITRDFFRKSTELFDSTWQKYWGSWLEFKAAAGLEQTKTQRTLYSAVSKHASTDSVKNAVEIKNKWEGAFLKPSGERFQTILCGSDIHGHLCDPFFRRLFIDTARRVKPQKIVLNGDQFDFPNFSKYTNDPRTYNPMEEIRWNHKFFEDLREASPDSEIILLEGNHSARLVKYLMESSPSIIPILNELHGMGVSELIGLDKYQINYVAKANLSAFTENEFKKEIAKNYYIAYDTVLFHHFPQCKTWGMNAQSGHHHHIQVNSYFSATRGPYNWVQAGCGHIRNASYSMGEKWQNGFALWHVDTTKKLAQPEIIDCTGSACVIGGQWYQRTAEETLII